MSTKTSERFLVTGALGTIGAWACRYLVRQGIPVIGLDLGTNRYRLELIFEPDELDRLTLAQGDIVDLGALERLLDEHRITHVVHLAAMLIPLVRDHPPRGAQVNVVGTTNVFEASRRRGVRGVSYASSAAVYGPNDGGRIEDARNPTTLYGVFKLANEATAHVYWQDYGVRSVGLRPYVVYGPGRDLGLTATPTLAMEAAARGDGYHIDWGGRCQFHHAGDAGRTFVEAARAERDGAHVFNLGGPVSHMRDVVAAIEAAAPEVAGRITFDDVQLPFPEQLDAGELAEVVGDLPATPLDEGVRDTIATFRRRR